MAAGGWRRWRGGLRRWRRCSGSPRRTCGCWNGSAGSCRTPPTSWARRSPWRWATRSSSSGTGRGPCGAGRLRAGGGAAAGYRPRPGGAAVHRAAQRPAVPGDGDRPGRPAVPGRRLGGCRAAGAAAHQRARCLPGGVGDRERGRRPYPTRRVRLRGGGAGWRWWAARRAGGRWRTRRCWWPWACCCWSVSPGWTRAYPACAPGFASPWQSPSPLALRWSWRRRPRLPPLRPCMACQPRGWPATSPPALPAGPGSPPRGWSGPQGRAVLARFAPVALAAFLLSAGFGLVQAFQQVGTARSLLASSYGRVLGIKALAVAAMVPLSIRAWRRRPTLGPEAALALTAVALAALLAAYPMRPARLARAEAQAGRPAPVPAMPRAGDLTLGGHVGPVLFGLTIRPGTPGRNDLLVYLLPAGGELAAARISTAVAVDGHPVQVEACGPSCRRGAAPLAPGAQVQIALAGQARGAGVVAFRLPLLPAPDGSALLARMQARMHHLTTLGYTEVLSSGFAGAPLRSSYQQQAPDRLRVQTSAGSKTVWVGRTMYLQRHPGEGWIAQPDSAPYTVPSFVWDYLPTRLLDPRIVGAAQVDGVATNILAFFGPSDSAPIWFRLWVDPDGLVRRAEMRAAGHFMDQRYDHFDAPLAIEAPSQTR